MEDFESKLGSILNNPEMMGRIMEMAQSFGGQSQQQDPPPEEPQRPEIDFATIQADDHDFDFLTLGQMLADIADVAARYFRNMYHAGFVVLQGDKCAEIGDCLYLAL